MQEGRKRVRICLICIVFLAVVAGMFYYYYEMQTEITGEEGTLISQVEMGFSRLWQQ